jgi:hypothetical protein
MRKAGLHIALAGMVLLLTLPAMQMMFGLFKETPLNGAFTLVDKPMFTTEKWLNGSFQSETENYLKDHSGFKSFLVRLQNQVDFSLFRQANAEGTVIGKNKQLFEYDYIRSWLAIDYPGDSFVEKKLQRTKYVQEFLKREKNIDLIIVFEPGKASFYPEYLPEKYTKKKSGLSTYELYRMKAEELGIDFIDMHRYFLELKPVSKYPLYPRYGTHWSVYGSQIVADSLLRLLENRLNYPLAAVRTDSVRISSEPLNTDDDVLKTMNLLFQLKGEPLAYPVLSIDSAGVVLKPNVLTVADSYYFNIFNTRIPKHLFANEAFWYFNTLVYPEHYLRPTYTKDVNFQQEVEKQHVIFLMITERFVHKFDWRFIDQLYALYAPDMLKDPVYDKINDIMMVATWYAEIIQKSEKKQITLEESLIAEGKYLYLYSDTANYMIDYGVEHFNNIIRSDPRWMDHIREKAMEQGISVDAAVMKDALYIFQQDYPSFFQYYHSRRVIEDSLRSNAQVLDSLSREASKYHFNPDQYIKIIAGLILKDKEIARSVHAIKSDPPWLEDVKRKALSEGITTDEMIRKDAEYMWNERFKKF